MSGPPKTPTHLRLVRGNPSKRPINKNEPKPPAGVPPTPKHFDKQAKYWFKRMAEELDAVGVISQLDARALELLVEAYTEYRHHCDTLEIEGYTYRTGTQTGDVLIKAHPAAMMKADAWKRLRAMLSEFGMTPASRSKVSANTPDAVDPLAEFMKARD
ncbi:phage terminase small subunit P27 family [Cronobacter sakazakii]|nr:phage terminase small subunit P27 family [Cronobacter sakazakii]EMC4234723.1 phage terminase small subunit P27 family [Cronobacter sakazakii]EMC4247055.1 phage terminase small subunit P27 family [Cronobacter sakazakii]EMC4251184.1 phage terminase small subunit P27 family [Cronobacter sakazakii]EMC4255498.1 phage terminase small subunit P27 family [Cronobacter sakazakii]